MAVGVWGVVHELFPEAEGLEGAAPAVSEEGRRVTALDCMLSAKRSSKGLPFQYNPYKQPHRLKVSSHFVDAENKEGMT